MPPAELLFEPAAAPLPLPLAVALVAAGYSTSSLPQAAATATAIPAAATHRKRNSLPTGLCHCIAFERIALCRAVTSRGGVMMGGDGVG
jgi:hypothetical protein